MPESILVIPATADTLNASPAVATTNALVTFYALAFLVAVAVGILFHAGTRRF